MILRKLIEQLYFKQPGNLALYDQLTGCHNYNWLELVADKKYLNRELYVTVFDVNGFKEINDTKGHIYGNKVLKDIALQLHRVKDIDKHSHVIRFGGDEFLVFSSINIEDYIKRDSTELISYGLVLKQSGRTITDAMNEADRKMYEYKKKLYQEGKIKNRREN